MLRSSDSSAEENASVWFGLSGSTTVLQMMPFPNASRLFTFGHIGEERMASGLEPSPPEGGNSEDYAVA
jgi:hypothetical protein